MHRTRTSDIDRISEALNHVLKGGTPAPIELPPDFPDDEIRQLTAYVNRFLEQYQLLAHAASAFCSGDIDVSLPRSSLHICQSLKNLQANLRHLTWCTAQVAEGDYSQRVDFMGEFSRSFNRMVETLDANRTALLRRTRPANPCCFPPRSMMREWSCGVRPSLVSSWQVAVRRVC